MATIVAQATGNWSAGATWTGGTPPGPGDTAQTGNFTVTIDQDITVTQLNPTGSGRFEVSTSGIDIVADVVMGSTYTGGGVRFAHTTGTCTIVGNITGGSTNSSSAVNVAAGGGLTVTGNVTGGSGTLAVGVNNGAGATVNVNGTGIGGSGNGAYGVQNSSTGAATVTTAQGGTHPNGFGVYGANAGGTTKVKYFVFSSQGQTPTGGFIFIDEDAANNTAKFRTSSGGAEVTLVHSSLVITPDYPAVGDVQSGVSYDSGAKVGTLVVPAVGDVQTGVGFGAGGSEFTGTLDLPAVSDVEDGVGYGAGGTEFEGNVTLPAAADVQTGVQFGAAGTEFTGTFSAPAAGDVQAGVTYGGGGTEFAGTLTLPDVGDVRDGEGYGAGGTEFEGTLTLPAEGDVRVDVTYGANGSEFTGELHVPDSFIEQALTVDVDDGDHEALRAFYPGTTKTFALTVKVGGVTQDLTADTVTFRMKAHPDDDDDDAAIVSVADVASSGATGIALFEIHPADTAVTARAYAYDVVWNRASGHEYILMSGRVQVKDRVSDVE